MSIIKEIHQQPEWLRTLLFVLSAVTVMGIAGYVLVTTFEQGIILAIDPVGGPERVSALRQDRPDPLGTVRGGVSSTMANIGTFLGFDREAGFDIDPQKDDDHDRIYLLPLSE